MRISDPKIIVVAGTVIVCGLAGYFGQLSQNEKPAISHTVVDASRKPVPDFNATAKNEVANTAPCGPKKDRIPKSLQFHCAGAEVQGISFINGPKLYFKDAQVCSTSWTCTGVSDLTSKDANNYRLWQEYAMVLSH